MPGYEAEVLKRFEEPTWNNPVVRFLDSKAKDVLPRKDRQWKLGQMVSRMTAALKAAKQTVPDWLRTLATETHAGEVQTAVFAMT